MSAHACALDGCAEPVPRKPNEHDSDWRRRKYCGDAHKRIGMGKRAPAAWRAERRTCAGRDCEVVFTPNFRTQQLHAQSCQPPSRTPRATGSKTCECGCGVFERPPELRASDWAKRRFATPQCYHRWSRGRPVPARQVAAIRQPGAARAGNRKPPKVIGAKPPRIGGNARIDQPPGPPRTVFGDAPPAEPFRPGRIPTVEPYQRAAPRPSFGLTRRARVSA